MDGKGGDRESREIGVTPIIEFLYPRSYYRDMHPRTDYVTYILVLVGLAIFARSGDMRIQSFNLGLAASRRPVPPTDSLNHHNSGLGCRIFF